MITSLKKETRIPLAFKDETPYKLNKLEEPKNLQDVRFSEMNRGAEQLEENLDEKDAQTEPKRRWDTETSRAKEPFSGDEEEDSEEYFSCNSSWSSGKNS